MLEFLPHELSATWVRDVSKFFFTSTSYISKCSTNVKLNGGRSKWVMQDKKKSTGDISAPRTGAAVGMVSPEPHVTQPPDFWQWLPPGVVRSCL